LQNIQGFTALIMTEETLQELINVANGEKSELWDITLIEELEKQIYQLTSYNNQAYFILNKHLWEELKQLLTKYQLNKE
jgi:replicative DNA helicase